VGADGLPAAALEPLFAAGPADPAAVLDAPGLDEAAAAAVGVLAALPAAEPEEEPEAEPAAEPATGTEATPDDAMAAGASGDAMPPGAAGDAAVGAAAAGAGLYPAAL
jgi:hypothetical protein